MAETTTRGWVAAYGDRAERVRQNCWSTNTAFISDIEMLAGLVQELVGEVQRLHGVIRGYQARVGDGGGSRG